MFDLCSHAATFITERHVDSVRGSQPSLGDQRQTRAEQQTKVRFFSFLTREKTA